LTFSDVTGGKRQSGTLNLKPLVRSYYYYYYYYYHY
jgi:hypothetical protein